MNSGKLFCFLLCVLAIPVSLSARQTVVPVLSLLLDGCEQPREPGWGADVLSDADRPETAWMNSFSGVTPVLVSTTVETALADCPDNQYCVLKISGTLTLSQTVYLDRPKTMIVGDIGNTVRYQETVSNPGAFFEIGSNSSEIIIEGLNIDGNSKDYGNRDVYGIVVYGTSINRIAMVNNEIHHLFSDSNAHGIAVYGEGGSDSTAVQNLIIRNNVLHDLRTGSSESVVVNGNVKNWSIAGNRISNVNNIAIDAIGGEGTAPIQTTAGRVLPGEFDAARYGFIENNSVSGMSTVSNPQYGNKHSWAAAIYIDGAHHIRVAGNRVKGSEWAYEIGAENCVRSRHVQLDANRAENSYFGDFVVGGYAVTGFEEDVNIGCDPLSSSDNDEGHGYVENITVACNQFRTMTVPAPFVNSVEISHRIRQAYIVQIGVQPEHIDGVVSGDQNSIRVQ